MISIFNTSSTNDLPAVSETHTSSTITLKKKKKNADENFLYFSKEITTKNSYDGAYGINSSQTGSTSDKLETSPKEQQQLILQHNIVPDPTHKDTYVTSPNKVESEQIFIEHTDNTGKKIKGFGETALTKVGHWSKSAFNFFRIKNANSGTQ